MKLRFPKLLALLLAAAMLFSLTACSSGGGNAGAPFTTAPSVTPEGTTDPSTGNDPVVDPDDGNDPPPPADVDTLTDDDLKYVLVYNPQVYNENERYDRSSLQSGTFGSQIDIDINRADGLEEDPLYTTIDQGTMLGGINLGALEGNRADEMSYDYKVGDVQEFYCNLSSMDLDGRDLEEFTCVYSGDYCHIWVLEDLDEDILEECGDEFDSHIYEEMISTFGEGRFISEDGGKLNLLIYSLPQSNLMGFFWPGDLLMENEIKPIGLDGYDCNTNHAIIHLNSDLLDYPTALYSTVAHEFQHLLCFSTFFESETMVGTWLNEAMSGYIEELFYPGIQLDNGRFDVLHSSDLIRNGQSMYNFYTSFYDIGVYGSVYLYTEYLTKLAGDSVFSKLYEYWTTSYSDTLCDAEALYNAVSPSVRNKIDGLISYPSSVEFSSSEEEWMSKLTLDYYLSYLSNKDNISAFRNLEPEYLLYDQLDGADIEGGGRLILAVKDNTFTIPEDADSGLVYVGLDEDFNVITDFICK